MLFQLLIPIIIILSFLVYYIYYVAPRKNPINRAQHFISQKMYDKAVIEYKKMLDKNPGNIVIHYRLGNLYFMMDKIDEGVIHFQEVLKINKFNIEVDKILVIRKLAKAYFLRDEVEEAFQGFLDILSVYPNDEEALYHVSFISLGQELFEMANRHFDRLVKVSEKNFSILFGAGMARFQEQKTGDAVNYFKEALKLDTYSDIGNICTAFALQWKSDFKNAITYAKMVIDNSKDKNAVFIAQRLVGHILVRSGKFHEALKIFQEIFESLKRNDLQDEMAPILYDIGFISLKAEKNEMAYDYWNQCYQYDRSYRNIQKLITLLRREMDKTLSGKQETSTATIDDYIDEWNKTIFPENFIWNICGLKSNNKIDLNRIHITSRGSSVKKSAQSEGEVKNGGDNYENLDKFHQLDVENFRIISNRVVQKLGYNVDEILNTYKESDGVDFIAHSVQYNKKALIWIRRWKDTVVGEIPLRNFAQAINDLKVNEGLFITTDSLSPSAEGSLKNLNKINLINQEQLNSLLKGII